MNPLFEGRSNRLVLLVFLAIALYACYWLIQPYLESIILAMLIGILAHPLHIRLVERFKGRQSSAALVSCLLLCLVCLLPFTFLLIAVLKQGVTYSILLKDWATEENIQQFMSNGWVLDARGRLEQLLPPDALTPDNIRSQALSMAAKMGGQFAGVSTALLGSITSFFINIMLLLFVLFFVLRDYTGMIGFMRHALPLSRTQEDILFEEVREVSKSALLGSLLTALTQGFVGGFGLWMAGFPGVFWGSIMAFTSMIPVVGTALIWIPAAIFLAVTGEMGWALFLTIWGVVVVGSVDNFLRPMFMQGASMNTVVVFFSLLGGLHIFGLMGLIYGPVIFSITLVLFRLYEKEFSGFLDSQDSS
ncbi:MAG: putative PurR-regulated permease PerM [Halioglobus sp.]|jgi:predicted PurR-regulated permease PerM